MNSDLHRGPWSPDSWQSFPVLQEIPWGTENAAALAAAKDKLRRMPPLVTSWEIEALRLELAEAQEGKRFVLQGGDCAETFDRCTSNDIAAKLKVLLQASLVFVHEGRRPVVRIGRFGGQYGKPRSAPTETIDGVELPSYFGDLVNAAPFETAARRPDPSRLLDGYAHAAATLNFVRSLGTRGFSDLAEPSQSDLSFLSHAALSPELRAEYTRIAHGLRDAVRFVETLGERPLSDLFRTDIFASHEGLVLDWEAAQTRTVPRRDGYYNLSTHLPWIGERTRKLGHAHVEFFRGIRNPVGVKIGPTTTPGELLDLLDVLDPENLPGKIVLITRFGAGRAPEVLPPLIAAIQATKRRVLWIADPMHGNGEKLASGQKTRRFDRIVTELDEVVATHRRCNSIFGGVHLELTGEDVTECLGAGVEEEDLARNFESACDPRLNYRQALEIAFRLARLVK